MLTLTDALQSYALWTDQDRRTMYVTNPDSQLAKLYSLRSILFIADLVNGGSTFSLVWPSLRLLNFYDLLSE
jgi:hypothetical protein